MAQIGNTAEASYGDGLNTYINIDTVNKLLQIMNGALIKVYSDAGTTLVAQLGGAPSMPQSATAPAVVNAATIATAGVGVARISPAAARTGIILAAGTVAGQMILVLNEAVVANSIQFDVSGTSNVADGTNEIIPGGMSRLYIWDSSTSLWYADGSPLVAGALTSIQSATAVAIAGAGTIATAGVGVSRLNPAAAVTGIIMAAGTYPGQLCLVVNEAAVGKTITFNTTPATANVADSATEAPLDGLQSRLFVWDSAQSLWFPVGNPLINGTYVSIQSATAVVIVNTNTITTAGVGVSRVAPGGAVTGIILQAGTYPGQEVTVVNESTAANTVTFNTTPATANVADSATEANIPGLTARSFVWDSSTSLWYRQN